MLVINKLDNQELPRRSCPILVIIALVWLQTELDSTQSYYHYNAQSTVENGGFHSEKCIKCFTHTLLYIRWIQLKMEVSPGAGSQAIRKHIKCFPSTI